MEQQCSFGTKRQSPSENSLRNAHPPRILPYLVSWRRDWTAESRLLQLFASVFGTARCRFSPRLGWVGLCLTWKLLELNRQIQKKDRIIIQLRQIQYNVVKRDERRIKNRGCRTIILIFVARNPVAPDASHICVHNLGANI